MCPKQWMGEEKVVYLTCPCLRQLRELKEILERAGFQAFYSLNGLPEDAIIIHVHCPLTKREQEILQAVLETGSIKSAAIQLGLSVNTVHRHLRNIAATLGVRSTYQAIAIAITKGFIRWNDKRVMDNNDPVHLPPVRER